MGNPIAALNSQLALGGAAREKLFNRTRASVRPVLGPYRRTLERARYGEAAILPPEVGNANLEAMVGKSGAAGMIGGTELSCVLRYLDSYDSNGICTNWVRTSPSDLPMFGGLP